MAESPRTIAKEKEIEEYLRAKYVLVPKGQFWGGVLGVLALAGLTIAGSFEAARRGLETRSVQEARDLVFKYEAETRPIWEKLADGKADLALRSLVVKAQDGSVLVRIAESTARNGVIQLRGMRPGMKPTDPPVNLVNLEGKEGNGEVAAIVGKGWTVLK